MLICDKYIFNCSMLGRAWHTHWRCNSATFWDQSEVKRSVPFNKHGKLPLVIVALNIAWTDCGVRNCSIQVPSFPINIVLLGLTWLAQPPSCHPRGKQWVCIFFINNWNGPVYGPAYDCHQKTFLADRSATWIKLWIYVRHVLPLTHPAVCSWGGK